MVTVKNKEKLVEKSFFLQLFWSLISLFGKWVKIITSTKSLLRLSLGSRLSLLNLVKIELQNKSCFYLINFHLLIQLKRSR